MKGWWPFAVNTGKCGFQFVQIWTDYNFQLIWINAQENFNLAKSLTLAANIFSMKLPVEYKYCEGVNLWLLRQCSCMKIIFQSL